MLEINDLNYPNSINEFLKNLKKFFEKIKETN